MQINRCPKCGREHIADISKKVVTTYDKVVAKWNKITKGDNK